jgi:hypothetical protein
MPAKVVSYVTFRRHAALLHSEEILEQSHLLILNTRRALESSRTAADANPDTSAKSAAGGLNLSTQSSASG